MGKIDDLATELIKTAKKINKNVDLSLMTTVCRYLGPNLFRKDSSLVAYSDKNELIRIRENFVIKKLDIRDSNEEIDDVILRIGESYGMSVRNKKRAIIYALLMVEYDKTEL